MFFSQNDGTLMALGYAMRYPILTLASGPTNSVRGAAFLSGLRDAIVVDVGGTSTNSASECRSPSSDRRAFAFR